jgi:hypothetical protein
MCYIFGVPLLLKDLARQTAKRAGIQKGTRDSVGNPVTPGHAVRSSLLTANRPAIVSGQKS